MQRVCGCKLEDGCDWKSFNVGATAVSAWWCNNVSGDDEQSRKVFLRAATAQWHMTYDVFITLCDDPNGRKRWLHSSIAQYYLNYDDFIDNPILAKFWLDTIEKTKQLIAQI